MHRWNLSVALVAGGLALGSAAVTAQVTPPPLPKECGDATVADQPLPNSAGALQQRKRLKILAIGSSSKAVLGLERRGSPLLESILEPSKLIEEKYITYLVVNTDGVPRTGVLVERTPEGIELRDAENKSIRLKHSEIEELTRQRQSLMPEGLLSNLTAQQAADLLSYLESLK